MATTYTPNLDLPKHEITDPFDITLINEAMDKTDAAVAGKAPAGYGLGERLAETYTQTEVDAFVFGGAKRYYNTDYTSLVPGMPGGHDVAIVNLGADPYFLQLAISCEGTIVAVRHFRAGVYGEWEWINPPMVLGVEYRTTERWDGKVVYAKYVSYGTAVNDASGALPDGAKTLIRHAGMLDNLSLPLGDIVRGDAYAHSYYSTSGAKELFLDTDATAFGSGAYTWYESLWYVKE